MLCHMCGEPAEYTCDECGRPVCETHRCGTDMEMYYGACEACFKRLETIRWENYKRRQQEQETPVAAPASPAPVLTDLTSQPRTARARAPRARAPRAPTVDRYYVLQWGGWTLALLILGYLTARVLLDENFMGALFFGGLAAKIVHSMLTSDTVRWLLGRLGVWLDRVTTPRSRAAAPRSAAAVDARVDHDPPMHRLLGASQADVIACLGQPDHVQDLSLRDGILPDMREPVAQGLHVLSSRHDAAYTTYPGEVIPGLRLDMPRRAVEEVLGPPMPEDDGEDGPWVSYRTPPSLADVGTLSVFYGADRSAEAPALIIALSRHAAE